MENEQQAAEGAGAAAEAEAEAQQGQAQPGAETKVLPGNEQQGSLDEDEGEGGAE